MIVDTYSSEQQRNLLLLSDSHTDTLYHPTIICRLAPNIDCQKIAHSVLETVSSYDALYSTFSNNNETPYQKIQLDDLKIKISKVSYDECQKKELIKHLNKIIESNELEVSQKHLAKFVLLNFASEIFLVARFHHAVFDYNSFLFFIHDLNENLQKGTVPNTKFRSQIKHLPELNTQREISFKSDVFHKYKAQLSGPLKIDGLYKKSNTLHTYYRNLPAQNTNIKEAFKSLVEHTLEKIFQNSSTQFGTLALAYNCRLKSKSAKNSVGMFASIIPLNFAVGGKPGRLYNDALRGVQLSTLTMSDFVNFNEIPRLLVSAMLGEPSLDHLLIKPDFLLTLKSGGYIVPSLYDGVFYTIKVSEVNYLQVLAFKGRLENSLHEILCNMGFKISSLQQ